MNAQEAEKRALELYQAETAIKNMSRVASALWGISEQFSNAGTHNATVERINKLRVEFKNTFVAAEKQFQEEVAKELPAIHAAHEAAQPKQTRKGRKRGIR